MHFIKTFLSMLIVILGTLVAFGCSGGEANYSLDDVNPITINRNIDTSPNVFPALSQGITTVTIEGGSGDALTYALSGEDKSFFSIDTNGTLFFIKIPYYSPAEDADQNNIFQVSIQVFDGKASAIVNFFISIAEDAEHVLPSIATSYIVLNENVSAVQIQASSGTVADLTYSLDPGYDETLFTINATTGLLSFVTTPNFENPHDSNANNDYMVTVRVTDQSAYANTSSRLVTLTVVNVDETPTALKFDHITDNDTEGLDHFYIVDDTHVKAWYKDDYTRSYKIALSATGVDVSRTFTYSKVSGESIFSVSASGEFSIDLPKRYGERDNLPTVINVCDNVNECRAMTLYVSTW